MTFASRPAAWPAYVRAVLRRRPALASAPLGRIEAVCLPGALPRAHLEAYRRSCGFAREGVPLSYPHVLALPLHLRMLTAPEFPVRILGLIHLRSRMEGHLPEDEPCELRCWLEGYQETPRGQEFHLFTECGPHWRGQQVYLARRPAAARAAREPGGESIDWQEVGRVRSDAWTGIRYARLSGDWNPIHLTALTSRWFGFPRPIAHGMWSLARCLALMPPTRGVEAAFQRPFAIPGEARLERAAGQFRLMRADSGEPILRASTF